MHRPYSVVLCIVYCLYLGYFALPSIYGACRVTTGYCFWRSGNNVRTRTGYYKPNSNQQCNISSWYHSLVGLLYFSQLNASFETGKQPETGFRIRGVISEVSRCRKVDRSTVMDIASGNRAEQLLKTTTPRKAILIFSICGSRVKNGGKDYLCTSK